MEVEGFGSGVEVGGYDAAVVGDVLVMLFGDISVVLAVDVLVVLAGGEGGEGVDAAARVPSRYGWPLREERFVAGEVFVGGAWFEVVRHGRGVRCEAAELAVPCLERRKQ